MPAKTRTSKQKKPAPSSASQVEPGVFVGGWSDAVGFPGARFCVLDEVPDEPVPAETHLPIYDPEADRPIRANLDKIADLAAAARRRGEPVLFFCGHGIRRGPLAAAWFLHRSEDLPLPTAYNRIRAVRPRIETAADWAGDVSVLEGDAPAPRR
jgi:hypothetical protein